MATVPRNPDGPPYRPYHYCLTRPQTRRTNSLTGSLSNAAGGPLGPSPTARPPESGKFFAPNPARPKRGKRNVDYYRKMRNGNAYSPCGTAYPRGNLYFVRETTSERARVTSALPTLTASYLDVRPHRLPLRQPTDLRRYVRACQNLFEVRHLQERARIVNLS